MPARPKKHRDMGYEYHYNSGHTQHEVIPEMVFLINSSMYVDSLSKFGDFPTSNSEKILFMLVTTDYFLTIFTCYYMEKLGKTVKNSN